MFSGSHGALNKNKSRLFSVILIIFREQMITPNDASRWPINNLLAKNSIHFMNAITTNQKNDAIFRIHA